MGVDIIEAGFPIASEGDFEAVQEIAKRAKKPWCAGWPAPATRTSTAPARPSSLPSGRIHAFISTSPCTRSGSCRWTRAGHEIVIASATRARKYTDNVEWSPEDATRTEPDFLCRCVEAAIKAAPPPSTSPIPSATPCRRNTTTSSRCCAAVPNADKARFSAHCHDDLGMAVANSLAGVRAGIRQIECTINGIGERAGNASLEEVVMALKVRDDYCRTGLMSTRPC